MTDIAVAVLWLAAAGIFLYTLWTRNPPEPPEGVEILHDAEDGWNYRLINPPDDAQWGIGYLTRGSAVRAARAELKRLQERDNA